MRFPLTAIHTFLYLLPLSGNSSVFRCALKVMMAAELLVTVDRRPYRVNSRSFCVQYDRLKMHEYPPLISDIGRQYRSAIRQYLWRHGVTTIVNQPWKINEPLVAIIAGLVWTHWTNRRRLIHNGKRWHFFHHSPETLIHFVDGSNAEHRWSLCSIELDVGHF